MTRLRTTLLAVAVLFLLAAAAPAQEPIRFARLPDVSPDGSTVAFSYLGDVWTVPSIGGVARPVTLHEAHDTAPAFSPDGKWLAFSSNRHGSYDVFVVPVEGGRPRRLTYDSAADMVCGWSPDGKNILFASTRSVDFPGGYQLYTVPTEGGRVRHLPLDQGKEAVYSPKGDKIAYVRGHGLWYRKGYRGSSNDDVWVCNADGGDNRRITTFNGQDTSPMWGPDGQTLYYVSEFFGTPANVVRHDLTGKHKPQLVTHHKDEGVRRARISANGDWIVYECGADLYVASTRDDSSPLRKLAIEVHADDKVNPETTKTYTDGASEFALSRDERHVAFALHGKLFLMPTTGGKAVPLTDGGSYDHDVAWAPDSSKILFVSDRNGQEDVYALASDDPEHPRLVDAHKFKATALTNTPEAERGLSFSPDGKRVGFLRSGKLWTMKPDGSDAHPVVNDVHVIDYEWSPDSKWLCYARRDGSFASEMYIVPSTGATEKDPARNVTRYATVNMGITWSLNGKYLAFLSERPQTPAVYVLPLQKPAAPGASSGSDIDWEDIHLRAKASPLPTDEAAISPDGTKVAFRSVGSGGSDLWVASSTGGHISRLTHGGLNPKYIQWSRRTPNTVYFLDGKGAIRSANLGGMDLASLLSARIGGPSPSSSDSTATIGFKVKMTVRRDEEFAEMFEQSWRALLDNFYDAKFHGVDWYAVRAKYRPLVKHVALKEDLYALISLMMGELNASHLGISGPGATPDEHTAELGLVFDESYRGPGLKVAEVLNRGPADRRGITIKPGSVVTAIDGTELTESTNLSRLLNDKVGETVALTLQPPAGADGKELKAKQHVEIQAASRHAVGELMYERWVERNARRVAELSHGKLGYIHIPSMDDQGLDHFVRSLYSDNFDKEAIVLDVRYNGGGFTHDQILNYLGAKEHTIFRQRDGGEGLVLRSSDRKWTKPLVLLINGQSYSDAEIFPSAFRALGLGKLVGEPTGGMVIGTSAVELIDGSSFRIPRIGVYTTGNVDMETHGVAPDVLVEDAPDQLAKGQDAQLDRAVQVLEQDVIAWKKTRGNVASRPEASRPTAPATAAPTLPPAGSK